LNNISFETLENSNAQITKVETLTNSINLTEVQYVALDFNGIMVEALQYVNNPYYDNDNKIESGDFIYFNLDGTFLDAYRLFNYQITHRLVFGGLDHAGFSYSALLTTILQECDEDLNPDSEFCQDQLEEIVIVVNPGSSAYEHPIWFVYQNTPTESLDAGSSTGSGSVTCPEGHVLGSDSVTCHDIPCVDDISGKGDPLDNMEILGSRNNGVPGGQYGNGRGSFHDGVDLKAPYGTPIFAAHSGIVATYPYQANWNEGGNDAGNRVYINSGFNGDDLQLGYWHLGEVLVSPGQQVSQGQLIGYTGNTGNVGSRFSAGPHLHIRARKNGIKTDPEEFFNTDFGSQGQHINTCN